MRIIVEKENQFYISFDYDKRVSSAVVKLPNVSYNGKFKRWECPSSNANEVFNFGAKFGFQLPDKISKRKVFETASEMPKLKQEIELLMKLYEYQSDGVAYNLEHGSTIVGDQPGLGKTAISIATVIAKNLFPCLVICPASLKYNWEAEWKLWTNKHHPAILTDTIKHTWPVFHQMGMHDVFITNYESLKKFFVVSAKPPKGEKLSVKHIKFHPNISLFKSIIVDESHKVKEPGTMQSKLVYGISRSIELSLLLSGTPIVNKPIDLLSQILIINKINHFGGIANFREMCADEDRWAEINSILRNNCYFRREKKTVLKDLPDKYRQKVFCSIDNQQEYNTAYGDLEIYLKDYKNATDAQIMKSMKGKIMVQMGILKNISARGKLADVMEYIDDVVDSGEKIVVFIYLHEVADILKQHYPKALFFTGSETSEQRNKAVHDFQKCTICDTRYERHGDDHEFEPSDKQVIFVNYKSGGVGITLTAASRVAFVELPWHNADTDQCEDRCHRISQKNAVQVTYFLGKDTIDESIYQIINEKREMSNTCTGAEDNTEESTINSIIQLLNK